MVGFGGFCLVVACLLTAASIVGGLTIRPLPGEIEVVEILCGLAVFAFLPYCQLKTWACRRRPADLRLRPKAMNWTQLIGDVIIAC